MAAAQTCTRTKGSDACPLHPEHKVLFECEDCSPKTLICSECSATLHKRHGFREIKNVVGEKTDKIISFIQSSKQETLPALIQEKKSLIRKIEDNKKIYQDRITQAKEHGEKLKLEAELTTATQVSRFEYLLKRNQELLEKHQTVVEKIQTSLEKDIKEYEEALKSGTGALMYDLEAQVTASLLNNFPPIPTVTTCTFSPCKDMKLYIDKAFGYVQELGFWDSPTTLYEHDISYEIWPNTILPTIDDMAWTYGEDHVLHLIDSKGVEQKTVKLDVDIQKVCINPMTKELYVCCGKDNSIRRVNTETRDTTELFRTDDQPLSIAFMEEDRMVVYTQKVDVRRVRMYTLKGNVLNSYIYKGKYVPNFSVCLKTSNIALLGGTDGEVTLLSPLLQEIFRYKGEGKDHKKRTNKQQYKCHTAVFVDTYLLVGDTWNHMIHILGASTGECLHIVKTDSMSRVAALGMQQDGALLVGCQKPNKLLCIKYFDL